MCPFMPLERLLFDNGGLLCILDVQVPSTFLVSRPFSGKVCLAQYKGKWSRVEVRGESLLCLCLE